MSTGFITRKRAKRSERKAERIKLENEKRQLTLKTDGTKRPHGQFFFIASKGVAAAKRIAKKRKNISARAAC